MRTRTALIRTASGNLKIMRYDDYKSNAAFASDLRENGYKVLHIWAMYVSDAAIDEWEFLNRKR